MFFDNVVFIFKHLQSMKQYIFLSVLTYAVPDGTE